MPRTANIKFSRKFFRRGLRAWVLALGAFAVLLAIWSVNSSTVQGHGNELDVTVSTLTPDPQDPLTKLYRVSVVFAGDRDPVAGGTVTMTAQREEGGPPLAEERFTEVAGRNGLYVGEVGYARFGTWQVRLHVAAPLGQGNAESVFTDMVRPYAVTGAEEAALELEAGRVRRLQLFFKFGWWPDVANILARIVHSASALGYFAMTGAVVLIAWGTAPAAWPSLLRRTSRYFIPVTVASLFGLAATGMYSAAFDAPTNAPGIYDIPGLLRIPYGEAYLGAFLVKPLAWLALVYLAFGIGKEISVCAKVPPVGGGAAAAALPMAGVTPRLRVLTAANIGVGAVLAVDLSLVIYLHYLSHLGVFIPAS